MQYRTIKINEYKQYTEVRLNRPQVRNAMNGQMLDELIFLFTKIIDNPRTPLLLLRGEGNVFSAGADLNWMAEAVNYSVDENIEDSRKLYRCFNLFNNLPVTTVAWVHGAVVGGAIGLAAAADFVWITNDLTLRFSEVKLGLVPATVAPFVAARIGFTYSRQWMLTAMQINSEQMIKSGYADKIVDLKMLPDELDFLLRSLKGNEITAMGITRELLNKLQEVDYEESREFFTSKTIAKARTSNAAQKRIRQFLSTKNFSS